MPEAATYAGRSLRTIQRWIDTGRLTAYRYDVGRHRRKVDLDDVDTLLTPTPVAAAG